MDIAPEKNEAQPDFAIRYHAKMSSAIPDTDRRQSAMMAKWRKYRRDGDNPLEEKARNEFGNDFICKKDVVVFAEHQTKGSDGEPVAYTREALVGMVGTLNQRIEDTGDFPPLTDGHTPDNESMDRGARMPSVLGYDGPFRLGMIGAKNPRWAIFADEWHDKRDAEKLSKLRRRSPEVWTSPKLEDRFFDPIAALGAQTPRLDLGLVRLCRSADGRHVEKYSAPCVDAYEAAMPGSENVFVTTAGTGAVAGKKKIDNAKISQVQQKYGLSNDDLQQLFDAFGETKSMQWVESEMEENLNHNPEDQETSDMAERYECDDDDREAMASYMVGELDDEALGELMGKKKAEYAASRRSKYECDDEDAEMVGKYVAGECDDEEYGKYMAGKKSKYNGGSDQQETDLPIPNGEDEEDYSRREEARNEKVRYARIEAENKALSSRIGVIEDKRRLAERGAKLQTLRYQYAFDINKEVERCVRMDEAQFQDHLDVMTSNYSRIATDEDIPILYAPEIPHPGAKPDNPAQDPKVVEKAMQYCMAERKKGNPVEWAEALDHVTSQAS